MRGFRSLQSYSCFNALVTFMLHVGPHLKKVRDDKVNLVGF